MNRSWIDEKEADAVGVWIVRLAEKDGPSFWGEVKVSPELPLLEQEAAAAAIAEENWGETCTIGKMYPKSSPARLEWAWIDTARRDKLAAEQEGAD